MEQSSEVIISLRDVTKIYRVGSMDIHALRGVNLQLMRGEVCCVVGRSGSGKSTLLNLLAGLEAPTDGEIIISKMHVERMTQSELIMFRQKHVGFVFQSFNLMPYYTALENVAFPLVFMGMNKNKRFKLAKEMLCAVGLETHLQHKPMQMSGGQQQRVGIARALVTNPEIVFADEPTGNLDSKTSDEVMTMICDVARSHNKTLIMVTHDPNIAAFTDKAVHLLDGQITQIDITNHNS